MTSLQIQIFSSSEHEQGGMGKGRTPRFPLLDSGLGGDTSLVDKLK